MAKLTLTTIGSRYGSLDAINDNFSLIEDAIEDAVLRSGTTPNYMEADFDMNHYDILNCGAIYTDELWLAGVQVEVGDLVVTALQVLTYTCTAGQTTFSVSPWDATATSLWVVRNGITLPPTDVTTSGSNVTIPECDSGDIVVIRLITRELTDSSASAISITDTGGYFSSNDLEGAMQEIGAALGGGGGGGVTSVAVAAGGDGLSISGSPITSSGTITLSFANDLAAIEALSGTGFPYRNATDSWELAAAIDLGTSDVTGTLADARFPATLPAASGVNLTALNATQLTSGSVPAARMDGAAAYNLSAAVANTYLLGYRDIPSQTSGWTRGTCYVVTSGKTLNTSDMAAGYTFSIYNNSGSSITITQGAGVTLRLGGTSSTGNRTLALRGFATIWCVSGTEAVIMGVGVS